MAPEKSNINQDEKLSGVVTERNFETEVLRSKIPVLAVFLTGWSQPCQVLKPVLARVATACAGKIKIIVINADDSPCLGLNYAIQYIPTLLVFDGARVRARIVGTASAEAILSKLQPILNGNEPTKPVDGETPQP